MMVLGRGLIFQAVLASLPYTQTGTCYSDTIITLQNILTLQMCVCQAVHPDILHGKALISGATHGVMVSTSAFLTATNARVQVRVSGGA